MEEPLNRNNLFSSQVQLWSRLASACCFLCCAPLSPNRRRDRDQGHHVFQYWLYLQELYLRRYHVCTPTQHQKIPNWALKINSLLKIHTSVRVHSHPLSPSVHCNCELSSRSEPESSDTESKPLATPHTPSNQRLPAPFLSERRGVETGVEARPNPQAPFH